MRRSAIVEAIGGRMFLDDVELDQWEQALDRAPGDDIRRIINAHFKVEASPITLDEVLEHWQDREEKQRAAEQRAVAESGPNVAHLHAGRVVAGMHGHDPYAGARNSPALEALHVEAMVIPCPSCRRAVGERCWNSQINHATKIPHTSRTLAAQRVAAS